MVLEHESALVIRLSTSHIHFVFEDVKVYNRAEVLRGGDSDFC